MWDLLSGSCSHTFDQIICSFVHFVHFFTLLFVAEFDECDIKVYEEVVLTNYHTRVLALVGARKVGKRSLIKKLVKENPRKFQAAIPCKIILDFFPFYILSFYFSLSFLSEVLYFIDISSFVKQIFHRHFIICQASSERV